VDPLHYRDRLLRELPAGARITGISIRDLESDDLVYEGALTGEMTWEAVTSDLPPDESVPLATLRAELATLRAQRIVQDRFPDTVQVNGQVRPWRYRIDLTLSVSGDEGEQVQTLSLFFAERDGGDRQLVGSPDLDLVFEAMPDLINAVWQLTYADRDPGPVELTEPPEIDETER
jgi:hypothetical protein